MKSIIIFSLYFLLLGSILGMATFLMYHNIEGWGWLIFISIILSQLKLSVKETPITKDNS